MTTSEGIKYDSEKPKMNLLPPKAIVEISKVLTLEQLSMMPKTGVS